MILQNKSKVSGLSYLQQGNPVGSILQSDKSFKFKAGSSTTAIVSLSMQKPLPQTFATSSAGPSAMSSPNMVRPSSLPTAARMFLDRILAKASNAQIYLHRHIRIR